MFTGIVQEAGRLKGSSLGKGKTLFNFQTSPKFLKGVVLGESIAVDGICLTVMKRTADTFSVEAIPETLASTTLGSLMPGKARVNLEKALKLGDPLGGHLISGHVDSTGKIQRLERRGENYLISIRPSPRFLKNLVMKGSVALDGISLTVQKITKREFQAGIIPHTWKMTGLRFKREGDEVNLELDLLYQYALKALAACR